MPGAHAKLSPSAATRWISCPASVRLIDELPKSDESSVYAAEGTMAHALGEIEAGLYFGLITPAEYGEQLGSWRDEFDRDGYTADQLAEMTEHVAAYVETIEARMDLYPGSFLLLERRMDTGVENCWGTSDAVIVSPTHVEIVDLKYGMGVSVAAASNPQLRLYALGALDTFGDILGETETVRMTVFQPRTRNVDTEELTADYLRNWREFIVKPAAAETRNPNAAFGPSLDACRWCPLSGNCRAQFEKSTREDFGAPPETLTVDDLAAALDRMPEIKQWADALQTSALERAYSKGESIPGYKVVRGRSVRTLTEQPFAIQRMIDAGFKAEQVSNVKAKGIGELERLLGKEGFEHIVGDFVTKPEGKPALAPETDKRKAIEPESAASADFAE